MQFDLVALALALREAEGQPSVSWGELDTATKVVLYERAERLVARYAEIAASRDDGRVSSRWIGR